MEKVSGPWKIESEQSLLRLNIVDKLLIQALHSPLTHWHLVLAPLPL